jgi:hypothetical protein
MGSSPIQESRQREGFSAEAQGLMCKNLLKPSKNSVVCSPHFVNCKPRRYPSLKGMRRHFRRDSSHSFFGAFKTRNNEIPGIHLCLISQRNPLKITFLLKILEVTNYSQREGWRTKKSRAWQTNSRDEISRLKCRAPTKGNSGIAQRLPTSYEATISRTRRSHSGRGVSGSIRRRKYAPHRFQSTRNRYFPGPKPMTPKPKRGKIGPTKIQIPFPNTSNIKSQQKEVGVSRWPVCGPTNEFRGRMSSPSHQILISVQIFWYSDIRCGLPSGSQKLAAASNGKELGPRRCIIVVHHINVQTNKSEKCEKYSRCTSTWQVLQGCDKSIHRPMDFGRGVRSLS